MFHLVQSKTKSSNLIDHTIEKPGKLFDRPLETQFDHTVNHGCIVDIDPECKPLLPCLKVPEVERSQSLGKLFVSFNLLGATDRPVMDSTTLSVDKPRLQFCHRKSQGDIDRLL
jgi:hypothetical protein